MGENQVNTPQKKLLYEVSIIRPIVIFLLVFLHSFTKIAAGGGYTNDYQLASPYQWLCWLILGFMLETFVMVSGYVFAYQSLDLNRSYHFIPFFWKKFKRLIIPMLVFGLAYYFCFLYNPDTFELKPFLMKLFSGCGHLWFLPMLFWCFLVIWAIDRFHLSSWLTLILLAGVSIAPLPSLPLGFARLPHFIFYVYAGYFLWTKRGFLLDHCLKTSYIVAFWLLYVLLVVVVHLLLPEPASSMTTLQKGMVIGVSVMTKLLMSCCGIMALYLTVCKTTTKEGYRPKQWVIDASNDCYGVYVYHQFILVFLYFFTPIVSLSHPLLVPWIGFIVVFAVSLLLTELTLKTKVGQFLIGR